MHCVDTIAMYIFYIFIIDFSLEMLDLIHRIYEADESFRSLDFLVHTQLFILAHRHPDSSSARSLPLVLLVHYPGDQASGDSRASASTSSPAA